MSSICKQHIELRLITTAYLDQASWIYASVDVATNLQPLKYTVQLDMESLVYVVLHMALLFLPHNQSPMKVLDTIFIMFESRGAGPRAGAPSGGIGKMNNMQTRVHTGSYSWNSPLDKWLNTMIDYMAPLRGPANTGHRWTPPEVEVFWSSLLKQPIKDGDRIWTLPQELQRNAPHLFLGHGYQAPLPARIPTGLSKRTFESMLNGEVTRLMLHTRTTADSGNTADSSDDREVKRARGHPPNAKPRVGKARSTNSNSRRQIGRAHV